MPEKAELPMGAIGIYKLLFRFNPQDVDPQINLLSRDFHTRSTLLTFTDTKTGAVFERGHDDGIEHYPKSNPLDAGELRGGAVKPERLVVQLLTYKGEQVPPGTYSVVATYVSKGKPESTKFRDDGTAIAYPWAWQFWGGTIKSPPVTVTVTPVKVEEKEHRIPSALVFECNSFGLHGRYREGATQAARFAVRPGYTVGTRRQDRADLGPAKNIRVLGESESNGLPGERVDERCAVGLGHESKELLKPILAGERLDLRLGITIFETPIPPCHYWMLVRNFSNVLWEGTIAGTVAEAERGLADAGRGPASQADRAASRLRHPRSHPRHPQSPETSPNATPPSGRPSTTSSLLTLAPNRKVLEIRLFDEPEAIHEQPEILKPGRSQPRHPGHCRAFCRAAPGQARALPPHLARLAVAPQAPVQHPAPRLQPDHHHGTPTRDAREGRRKMTPQTRSPGASGAPPRLKWLGPIAEAIEEAPAPLFPLPPR